MTFLLDTNHAIAHLNGDPGVAARIGLHQATGDTFAFTTTVLGELYYGVYASRRIEDNLAALDDLLSHVMLYEFDASAADEFGKIKAEQRAKGKPIPTADAQIAAVARLNGFTVLTDDVHFQTIDGLDTDNWLV